MKIWFPISLEDTENNDVNRYILKCYGYLYTLRAILKSNIILPKWKVIETKLQENNLLDVVGNKFNISNIPYQYVNNLNCFYNANQGKCYYGVPDSIKCIGTNNNLNYLIRLCEYGNDVIPPLNWIRHSYHKFVDIVRDEENEHKKL